MNADSRGDMEENTDLLADGTVEFESRAGAERWYEANNLSMFSAAFARMNEAEQRSWMNRIYSDGNISFFSVCANQLKTDGPLVESFAETFYKDGSISFFSVLTVGMSGETMDTWLDRAVRDQKSSFQSMLLEKLNRGEERDALEEELARRQLEEYEAVGVTKTGKNYYYQGKLVHIFLDHRPDSSFYTLDMNPAGEVNVKIVRESDGTITGAAYMTDAEVEALFGQSDNP